MAGVSFETVSKQFGETRAVESVSLDIADGEFFALLGPSGCGKTTLLRLVAGFEIPDAGSVKLGGAEVGRPGWALPPEKRKIGMVFQSYALWPNMTVAENVAFALRVRRVRGAERVRIVNESLVKVGLEGLAERRPHELSGGQRQRVALARCLAMRPDVVLLDEPLANLDVHLRETMLEEFARFHKELRATFIYVTHDQAEALGARRSRRGDGCRQGRADGVAARALRRARERDGRALRRTRHGGAGAGDRPHQRARGGRSLGHAPAGARRRCVRRAALALPARGEFGDRVERQRHPRPRHRLQPFTAP